MNEAKYMQERIGINLRSIFLHNFFSSSAVSFGGGGRAVSPPKSMSDFASELAVSKCDSDNCFLFTGEVGGSPAMMSRGVA